MAGMMPSGMRDLLTQKYAIMQQQANAQSMEARASANLKDQNAKVVVPLANSSMAVDTANIGQVKANTDLTKVNTEWAPKRYQSDINNQDANTDFLNNQNRWYGPKTMAEIGLMGAQGRNYDATALNNRAEAVAAVRPAMDWSKPAPLIDKAANSVLTEVMKPSAPTEFTSMPPLIGGGGGMVDTGAAAPVTVLNTPAAPVARRSMLPTLSELPSFTRSGGFLNPFGDKPFGSFKRGVTSVPGKGSGDKMPAVLEPKEAVLNKHAADMLGRKKIAQLNKAGNEKRAQQDAQRTSKLAQALKQIGMI